jgi:hypothetical protein
MSERTMAQKGTLWPAKEIRRESEIGIRIKLYATYTIKGQMDRSDYNPRRTCRVPEMKR